MGSWTSAGWLTNYMLHCWCFSVMCRARRATCNPSPPSSPLEKSVVAHRINVSTRWFSAFGVARHIYVFGIHHAMFGGRRIYFNPRRPMWDVNSRSHQGVKEADRRTPQRS